MYQNMTRRIARLVGRNSRTEVKASYNNWPQSARIAQTSPGGDGRPTTGSFRQWLWAVPWRHVWILGLFVLLLMFALFGFFPRH
jgi:hypothetical protein